MGVLRDLRSRRDCRGVGGGYHHPADRLGRVDHDLLLHPAAVPADLQSRTEQRHGQIPDPAQTGDNVRDGDHHPRRDAHFAGGGETAVFAGVGAGGAGGGCLAPGGDLNVRSKCPSRGR